MSGFHLPERAAELSREEANFAISFFLPSNNRADPGKPVFSIGENEASHTNQKLLFLQRIGCYVGRYVTVSVPLFAKNIYAEFGPGWVLLEEGLEEEGEQGKRRATAEAKGLQWWSVQYK